MARMLTRFDHVIEELGGVTKAGQLIGRTAANLCQWRAKYDAFPASLWFVVNGLLASRGCEASARVFRFELPRKRGHRVPQKGS